MWNSLTGEITRKNLESIFLSVSNVEWDLAVSRTTLTTLPAVGEQCKVFTWLQHTEDSMRVFGFATVQERALFLDLIKVSGVGPKLALRCLSGLPYAQFAAALEAGDADRLAKVPGLGIKTAQKIILALKGKLVVDEDLTASRPDDEIIRSLCDMGFDRRACERVVENLASDPELASLEASEREKRLFQKALLKLAAEGQ